MCNQPWKLKLSRNNVALILPQLCGLDLSGPSIESAELAVVLHQHLMQRLEVRVHFDVTVELQDVRRQQNIHLLQQAYHRNSSHY